MAEEKLPKLKRGRPPREVTEARRRAEFEKLKAKFEPPDVNPKKMPANANNRRAMVTLDAGEAQKYTAVFLQQSGILDVHDEDSPECARDRRLFIDYMESCYTNDIIPANQACLSALHITAEDWRKTIAGQINPDRRSLYVQIERVLAAIREQLGMKSKINPATLIFWGKNFDGMKDEQDVIVSNHDQFGALPDGQKLADKYSNLPDK